MKWEGTHKTESIHPLQHRRPINPDITTVRNYLLRFLVSFFTMEFILHTMYVVAIKDRKAWVGDTPAQISMIGFWNLIVVWLKVSADSCVCV